MKRYTPKEIELHKLLGNAWATREDEMFEDMRNKVLVVEDDESVAEMMDEILSKKFDLVIAKTFTEAAAYFETNTPEFIITDYNFPGGDGKMIAEKGRELGVKHILLHSGDCHLHQEDPIYCAVVHKFDIEAILKFLERE